MPLPKASDSYGSLCFIELDQVERLAEMLGLTLMEESNRRVFSEVLKSLVATAMGEVGGVVLDPNYGLPFFASNSQPKSSAEAQKPKAKKPQVQTKLILPLEQSHQEVDPLALPKLITDWGVEAIANNYGVAKLQLYYHPNEELAIQKKQILAELYDHCQHEKIDLMVKLVIYTPADEEFDRARFQEAQLQAVEELRAWMNLAVLQYPQNSLACATLTTQLDIPWLVSGDGVDYENLKEIVRESMEAGAKGLLAGSALWYEIGNMRAEDQTPDFKAIETFIKTKFRDRLLELVRIATEFSQE